jgi:hypothetical protein
MPETLEEFIVLTAALSTDDAQMKAWRDSLAQAIKTESALPRWKIEGMASSSKVGVACIVPGCARPGRFVNDCLCGDHERQYAR